LIPGGGPKLPVGRTEDFKIQRRETEGPDVLVRVFTPAGKEPEGGWPVMLYYHGGGWVLGNIETENTVCTNLCKRVDCVVITVDYRLAPESPYPAAVHDSWEALLWLHTRASSLLPINPSKYAIGGSSAGGNLAAVMCQKILSSRSVTATKSELHIPMPLIQLLLVPVTDNTALVSTTPSWKENEFTPALPALKMLWYRNHYLPDPQTWSEPEATPLLWEGDWGELPRALVVVGELDVLRDEGIAFAEKLGEGRADLKIMKGMPHPFLAMDGVLQQGKDAITFMVEGLKGVFT
jgi:triacylglycerol lipase